MKTILVIDDEYSIVEILVLVLSDAGYRCVHAADGREGLHLLGLEKVDLVITDLMMPIADGRDVLLAIRADPSTKDLPVILMSAARGAVKGENLGEDAFVQKPFSLDELLGHVKRLIGG